MRANLCLVLVCVSASAHADLLGLGIDSLDLPSDRGELSLTARASAPDAFDTVGNYQDESIALRGALPVYSSGGFRVLAQPRLDPELVQSTAFAHSQQIVKSALGATVSYVSEAHDVYALYAGAAVAASRESLSQAELMPSVIGLGTARRGSLTWLYGGGFGYALGRSWLLPVAGVIWRASPSWTVATLLPVYAELRARVSSDVSLALSVSVAGDRYQFANDGELAGASDTLTMRVAQARAGLKASYVLDSHWTLRAELGVWAPRRLQIEDSDTIKTTATSLGTPYFSTGVIYAFEPSAL
jgi:hypothetical protein